MFMDCGGLEEMDRLRGLLDRSPNLNCCDYLWGYLKAKVYQTRVENQEELLERIMVAAEQIQQNPEELAKVSASLRRRVEACIRENGGHFEHSL
jgi:hypothetical protein